MNRLSSQQRKFAYLAGILVLLVPIILLGMPSDGRPKSGGYLAQLRSEHDLGESDLGQVDPSSASMNLVLLGLRGVAANLLWMDLEYYKDRKDWAQMRATTESIIRLQPHFAKVWEYNGWNLAYNTSAEWDAVPDRYYWVKEGGKFLGRGVERNNDATNLYYHAGRIHQQKVGQSDEKKYFRDYYFADPDPKFGGTNDPEFNTDNIDNFLMGKKWFYAANDSELRRKQNIQDRTIFRSSPARAQFDYAAARQEDGKFDDETREAWAEALSDWTVKYGQEPFTIPWEEGQVDIRMEMTPEEIRQATTSDAAAAQLARAVDAYQKMTNYRYWRTRGLSEAEQVTSDAHREFYLAGEEYKQQNLNAALKLVSSSMEKFEQVLKKYPELRDEDRMVEECMLAIMLYENIHRLNGERLPDEFPLKTLAEEKGGLREQIEDQFKRRFLGN
jgi:hypothetical protein